MFIEDKKWDKLTLECLQTIDALESIDHRILIPGKVQILAILYDIVHLQDEYHEKLENNPIPIEE